VAPVSADVPAKVARFVSVIGKETIFDKVKMAVELQMPAVSLREAPICAHVTASHLTWFVFVAPVKKLLHRRDAAATGPFTANSLSAVPVVVAPAAVVVPDAVVVAPDAVVVAAAVVAAVVAAAAVVVVTAETAAVDTLEAAPVFATDVEIVLVAALIAAATLACTVASVPVGQ